MTRLESMSSSYFKYHVFFCTNLRDDGSRACGQAGAQTLRDYAKQRVKALGSAIPGKVRINNAGCLDRCGQGPVMVIYPEGTWYHYRSKEDVDTILAEHLSQGRVVEYLKI